MAHISVLEQPKDDSARQAIEYLRRSLPNDYLVCTSFEMAAGGYLYTYDAVVIAPHAIYVLEIMDLDARVWSEDDVWYVKPWVEPRVAGPGGMPDEDEPEGAAHEEENPLPLVAEMAGLLSDALYDASEDIAAANPWVQPLVVLTGPHVEIALAPDEAAAVVTVPQAAQRICDPTTLPEPPEAPLTPLAGEIERALREVNEQASEIDEGEEDEAEVELGARVVAVGPPRSEGERVALDFLSANLPAEYVIYTDLNLVTEDGAFTYDLIVLAPHALYVVDVLDLDERIWDEDGVWRLSSGRTMESPLPLTSEKASILSWLLYNSSPELAEADPWVQPLVVLTGQHVELSLSDEESPAVVTLDEAPEHITDASRLPEPAVMLLDALFPDIQQVLLDAAGGAMAGPAPAASAFTDDAGALPVENTSALPPVAPETSATEVAPVGMSSQGWTMPEDAE